MYFFKEGERLRKKFVFSIVFLCLLGISHSNLLAKFHFQTSFSASLGFNGGQWLAEGTDPGFSDLNIGITLPYAWDELRIIPFANYTFVLLDAIGKENHFWFGISMIYDLEK
jgi:hypothetical protein